MRPRNFRNYKVWQDSINFATAIYQETRNFPSYEKYGLASQLQRAAVSISSNIAEGAAKSSDIDFARFLDMALGSSYEVESQLLIAKNIGYFNEDIFSKLLTENIEIQKQLTSFAAKVREA